MVTTLEKYLDIGAMLNFARTNSFLLFTKIKNMGVKIKNKAKIKIFFSKTFYMASFKQFFPLAFCKFHFRSL